MGIAPLLCSVSVITASDFCSNDGKRFFVSQFVPLEALLESMSTFAPVAVAAFDC